MTDVSNVLQVGCGIVVMIAIGFGITKMKVVTPAQLAPINRFLFKCCFIPLIANNIIRRELSTINFMPLAVLGLTTLTVMLLLLGLVAWPSGDRFEFWLATMLPATYVNYIIIGVPIFESIWGSEDQTVLAVITLTNDLVTSPLYLILTGFYNLAKRNRAHAEKGEPKEKCGWRVGVDIFLGVLLNPIIIAYIIGFIWAGARIPVPLFVDEIIKYWSGATLAMSCLCVGSFLAEHSLLSCHWLQFVVGVVARHILCPIFAGLYAKAFGVNGIVGRQCIILATLPSAVGSYLLSSNAGVGTEVSSTLIFWTNIIFVPAIVIWFKVLDALNIFPEDQ